MPSPPTSIDSSTRGDDGDDGDGDDEDGHDMDTIGAAADDDDEDVADDAIVVFVVDDIIVSMAGVSKWPWVDRPENNIPSASLLSHFLLCDFLGTQRLP